MNLNQLYYFRTLAEYQHYTKAAAHLYISQPSLSNAMKSLEKELGCVLFKKTGRNIQLTEYGRMFYNTTCSTLNILDEGKRELQQKIKSDAGIINVACIPTSIGTRLPNMIKDFQSRDVGSPYFTLHDEFSGPILEGLSNGRYDVGICSQDVHYSDLSFIPLFSEPIVVIVAPDHPLAKETHLEPEQLRPYDLVTYLKNTPIGHAVRDELNAKCPNLTFAESLDSEVTIAGQVATNHSVGVVANTMFLDAFNIKRIPLDVPADTRMVYIAYNHTRQISPVLQKFIDFLKATKQTPVEN
ncbi:LysR family transcriptional regulator [Lactiplantibacillus plajomi]|uniref:LysR family transcriptional regulator n=1 Tax=Lactiplantibacillus plajomi TaxID=1457217 RepID=A0ABV6KAC2_9LACO|nr:LysR family transcriptional regulator [Lactiplantibacillus plajomi]